MEYFTERHGLRKTMDFSGEITVESYKRLFSCCEDYNRNIAWKFPVYAMGKGKLKGVNFSKLHDVITLDIPDLYYNTQENTYIPFNDEPYCQYALLDLIEYYANNIEDVRNISVNAHGEESFELPEFPDICFAIGDIFSEFQNKINNLFHRLGLLYILSDKKRVERVPVNTPLSSEIEESISEITEKGLEDLLQEAVELFKSPKPENQKLAVEKIWDALERLKTYYKNLDKKTSAAKIVSDMASGDENFETLFEDEFFALTKIGNKFRIRHHETDKIDITDPWHFDYFFNRCLSLIALALPYLEE